MSTRALELNSQLHRNPSRQKVRAHSIKSMKPLKNQKAENSFFHHTRADSTENQFLKKCFQNIYLQNIYLNEQVSKKNQQFTYLNFEHERLKKLNNPESRFQGSVIESKQNKSESLASGESINSSLITQKLKPVQISSESSNGNKNKFLFLLKDTLEELSLRKTWREQKRR